VRGSRKTRFEQLAAAHRFDQLVYKQALLTFLIDPHEIDDLAAPVASYKPASIDQEVHGQGLGDTWVPRTFACMTRIFDKCSHEDQRRALLEDWAKSVHLPFDDLARARAILALFETNEKAIRALANADLITLLSARMPLLPPRAARTLIGAVSYAGVPLTAPEWTPDDHGQAFARWQATVISDLYATWKREDRRLAMLKGNAVKFSNIQSSAQAGNKLGQAFAAFVAGSAAPPLLKMIMVVAADSTLVAGNVSPAAVAAAASIKLTGGVMTWIGCMFAVGLAFAYYKFIALKNLQLQDMEARGIQEVAHAGVIEHRTREFFTWINMRAYLRPEGWAAHVNDFTTISAARISEDHLPKRPMVFANEVNLAQLTWQQMFAFGKCHELLFMLFSFCRKPAPQLSDMTFIETMAAIERLDSDDIRRSQEEIPTITVLPQASGSDSDTDGIGLEFVSPPPG
jgi:hypothetical protein